MTQKIYYTIGQVSQLLELPQSVLRYWETVFPPLNPLKSSGGSRQYSDNDVELLRFIRKLLYEEGFTIKGANLKIENEKALLNVLAEEKKALGVSNLKMEAYKKDVDEDPNPSRVDQINHSEKELVEHIIGRLRKIVKILDDSPNQS
ncbi:MAG: MerR family transcriptional regulator [Caldithrix sp.]|nr:MerR family transcriptional regulator [Caldithrix sp.]